MGEFLHILITEAARSNKPVTVGELVTRSEAIVNKEYRDSPEDRAAVLDVLSGYYDTREEYLRAEESLRQALEIVKTSPDGDLRRKLMCSHAATQAKVGRVPEAIRVLNFVLADPQITVQQSARCWISLSRIAQASGDGPNALKFGQLALQRLRQDSSHPPVALEADFLADIGNAEYLNLHNDVAGQFYSQSLAKLMQAGLGRALDALAIRNNWSLVSYGTGNPRAALELLDQTLRLAAESEPDAPPEPTFLYNRAVLLEDLGRYRESRDTYLRCAAESRRTGAAHITVVCFVGLAAVSHELADPVSASSYLAAASANLTPAASPDSNAMLRLRTVKGSLALAAGRSEEARADLEAVISASKNPYRTMRALLIRAEVNLTDGMVAAAEADASRVLGLARTAQGSAAYSSCTGLSWLMLGRVLKRRGDLVGAGKALSAAVENLSNTVDAGHPKLLLARQLADDGQQPAHPAVAEM